MVRVGLDGTDAPAPGPAAEGAGRQRLFLALWPDDGVRAQLAALARGWLGDAGGRAVEPANVHATLVFLGEIDGNRRACVERAAAGVRAPAFQARLGQLRWRPRPQIAWLEAAEVPPALSGLVAGLNARLRECGFEPERRAYHLHVTLARKVRRRLRGGVIDPIDWYVDRFVLVESQPNRTGVVYQVLRSWPLAQEGDAP